MDKKWLSKIGAVVMAFAVISGVVAQVIICLINRYAQTSVDRLCLLASLILFPVFTSIFISGLLMWLFAKMKR